MRRKRKSGEGSGTSVMSVSHMSTRCSRLSDNNTRREDYERSWHDDFFRGWQRHSNQACDAQRDRGDDIVRTKMCSLGYKIGSLHGHNDLEEVNDKMEEYTKEWVEGLGVPSAS